MRLQFTPYHVKTINKNHSGVCASSAHYWSAVTRTNKVSWVHLREWDNWKRKSDFFLLSLVPSTQRRPLIIFNLYLLISGAKRHENLIPLLSDNLRGFLNSKINESSRILCSYYASQPNLLKWQRTVLAKDEDLYQTRKASKKKMKERKKEKIYWKLIVRGDHKWVMIFTFSVLSRIILFWTHSITKTNTNMIKTKHFYTIHCNLENILDTFLKRL